MPQPKALNQVQVDVLRWIARGCPEGVMTGHSHRISTGALRNRGYVVTTGRGPTWSAEITDAGRALLDALDGPTPPQLRKPNESRSERLMQEIASAGGRLAVPRKSRWDSNVEDYERLASVAIRHQKVPVGFRLRVTRDSKTVRLELIPTPPNSEPQHINVAQTVRRYHAVASALKNQPERQEVATANLSRALRILHSLATEAELRGYDVLPSEPDRTIYNRSNGWKSSRHGHLTVTVGSTMSALRIFDPDLPNRAWFTNKDAKFGSQPWSDGQIRRDWEANSKARLAIELVSGYSHGRQARWADRRRTPLEEQLGAVLWEAEQRAIDAEDDRQEAERKEAAQLREWEAAIAAARDQHAEHLRRTALNDQIERSERAARIRAYCAAVLQKYPDEPETAEWVQWALAEANATDPLDQPPTAPIITEPSAEELRPFLNGRSPYRPTSHR